jgi:hypothetical protein
MFTPFCPGRDEYLIENISSFCPAIPISAHPVPHKKGAGMETKFKR